MQKNNNNNNNNNKNFYTFVIFNDSMAIIYLSADLDDKQ